MGKAVDVICSSEASELHSRLLLKADATQTTAASFALAALLHASMCFSVTCRYVKSRSDSQLRGTGDNLSSTSDCDPEQVLQPDPSKLIMPCGLIAWSYFNDTYAVCHADTTRVLCARVLEAIICLMYLLISSQAGLTKFFCANGMSFAQH